MKRLALLLMIFMAMAGMPAEAAVVPVCMMEMPSQMSHHSCCPPGGCDCKIEIPRSQDLLIPDANFEIRLSAPDLHVVSDTQAPNTQKLFIPSEAQESPPDPSPLYEKYSDYRI